MPKSEQFSYARILGDSVRNLANKTLVITGASSGIGRALAIAGARHGANLALCDVDVPGLAATKADVERLGVRVFAAHVNVSDASAMRAFAADVVSHLGGADVVVNNAGVSLSELVGAMKIEDFEWLFSINFWGVVHGCEAFLPQLRQRPSAQIVNISSVFGLIGIPGQSAYCASKFAVRGYSESLRAELMGSKIGVTVVHPGGVKTNIVRNGRHYSDATGVRVDPAVLAREFENLVQVTPERAAAVILKAIRGRQRRVLIGVEAYFFDALQRLLPASAGQILGRLMTQLLKFSRPHSGAVETTADVAASGDKKPPLAG
jgi:NAD(P)-dependent dehydrogenase (short-subunit alcohol dehydrogenase family)